MRTAIWDKPSARELGIFAGSDYAPMMMKLKKLFVEPAEANGLPAEVLGRRMVEIFEMKKPKTRYTVVRRWLPDWILPRMLPDRVWDRIIGKSLGLSRN